MPLRTFRNMFPKDLDKNGYPTNTQTSSVKLIAYNGTNIPQYGTISLKCKYGADNKWHEPMFFVADTTGPVIFGLRSKGLLVKK